MLLSYLRKIHPSRMFENPQQYTGVSVLRFLGAEVSVEFEDAGDRVRLFMEPADKDE